ncbi:MAG: TetR family transcriptional regulator [Streptosporangiales bacterium]|nr:TetR family transcriptional regulator [Streptosporangiales bacterium]
MEHRDEPAGVRTRRRGKALEQAIYGATLAELAAVGYAGMTMEGVAERAGTGKASLYRRWSSKRDLALDALRQALPDPREVALADSVREELMAALTVMSEVLAGQQAYPGVDMMGELFREPELMEAFRERVIEPRLRLIQAIVDRGVQRGEVTPEASSGLIARTGPALVILTFLLTGEAPAKRELSRIVDEILLPLLTGSAKATR